MIECQMDLLIIVDTKLGLSGQNCCFFIKGFPGRFSFERRMNPLGIVPTFYVFKNQGVEGLNINIFHSVQLLGFYGFEEGLCYGLFPAISFSGHTLSDLVLRQKCPIFIIHHSSFIIHHSSFIIPTGFTLPASQMLIKMRIIETYPTQS